MLPHFLKIFLRILFKNPSYSFINISGLAAGLASAILISLWVVDEISYDTFHNDGDRIYQVMGNHAFPDGTMTYGNTPGPLGEALKELPEVEEACRILQGPKILVNYKDQSIYESGMYADPSVFKVFTVELVDGNRATPLPDNNSIAISGKMAAKYFGNEDAIGKVVRIDNKHDAKVTAVFRDLPENSTLRFDFVVPYTIYAKDDTYNQEWGAWTGGDSFVKLHASADVNQVNKKIAEQFTKPKIWPRWDSNVELFLFPLNEWRLHGNFVNGKQEGGRITYVRIFSAVAAFILLIACINFMNLATARSMSRAKEIGVRKVVGAARRSLTTQFMGESIFTSAIALAIGLLIVQLLLPVFNGLTEKDLSINYSDPFVLIGLIFVTVTTGLIAGSYPALFLSSLRTINVLKGKLSGLSGARIREGLVVFQFSMSVVLIVSALIIYVQLDYLKNKDIGFDRNNIIYFNTSPALMKNFEGVRGELLQSPLIKHVGQADTNPMDNFGGMVLNDNGWPGKTKEDNIIFKVIRCDEYFVPAIGFELIEGRNFSREFISDSVSYIVSEETVRRMRLKDPIGQEIEAPKKGKIVGVVRDFHSGSMLGPVEPVIISMRPKDTRQMFVRYEAGKTQETVDFIQSVYRKFEPDFPLEYAFVDQAFDNQYRSEILMGKLSSAFTIIAILISCLGLFGLASFTTERRTKEIGVRKVLGATVSGIVIMLCKDFVKLVMIGILIGCPIGYYFGWQFLSRYAFHVDISVWIFIATAGGMTMTTLLIVSIQAIRSAVSDPVKVLRMD